jgi:hypothetical protein
LHVVQRLAVHPVEFKQEPSPIAFSTRKDRSFIDKGSMLTALTVKRDHPVPSRIDQLICFRWQEHFVI